MKPTSPVASRWTYHKQCIELLSEAFVDISFVSQHIPQRFRPLVTLVLQAVQGSCQVKGTFLPRNQKKIGTPMAARRTGCQGTDELYSTADDKRRQQHNR